MKVTQSVNKEVDINNISDSFGNWFAGFTDGEGCFTAHIGRKIGRTGNEYIDIDPEFSIILRDDDSGILVEICRQLGFSTQIKYYPEAVNKFGVKSKPKVKLEIRRMKRCLRLIEIFDKFPLRAKKKRDYDIWRRLVFAIKDTPRGNKWHGLADRSGNLKIVEELKSIKRYDANRASAYRSN